MLESKGFPSYLTDFKNGVFSNVNAMSKCQTHSNTNLPLLPRSITGFSTRGLEMQNSLTATTWIVSTNIVESGTLILGVL